MEEVEMERLLPNEENHNMLQRLCVGQRISGSLTFATATALAAPASSIRTVLDPVARAAAPKALVAAHHLNLQPATTEERQTCKREDRHASISFFPPTSSTTNLFFKWIL